MRALLLRCYPARWRARYGDEFAAVLAEHPLGPFDVADVLLGALDAHLHLRGLGAASQHAKGFAMTLRIGGYAAIVGGALWFIAMLGSSVTAASDGGEGGGAVWSWLILAGTLSLLLALAGLSAFQARRYPRLIWAAFAVPALGGVLSTLGLVGMGVVGDRPFLGLPGPWYLWMLGTIALLLGSVLFALATWRTHSLARWAAVLLGVGALVIVPAAAGVTGAALPEPLGPLLTLVCFGMFGAGWMALGFSALRVGRPATSTAGGAA